MIAESVLGGESETEGGSSVVEWNNHGFEFSTSSAFILVAFCFVLCYVLMVRCVRICVLMQQTHGSKFR